MAFVLMILGFIWWWPVGLVLLGFVLARRGYFRRQMLAGDGQMMHWGHNGDRWERKIARAQEKVERVRERMEHRYGRSGWLSATPTSGNAAFDDYRTETLRRLEDEQREFKDFLGRLRVAKDRAEFDQFMADRRQRPIEPGEPTPPAPQA
jgi:hypothetical protein